LKDLFTFDHVAMTTAQRQLAASFGDRGIKGFAEKGD